MSTPTHGTVALGYEAVAEAFAAGFVGRPEMGAALCIRRDGKTVVDLWGGVADPRDGRPWTPDTPTVVFSCTKGLVSILAAMLVEAGRLDYSAPVARYWQAFAARDKAHVTVAEALSHRAGLSAPRRDLGRKELLDWQRMVSVLAEQEPLWQPGTGYAYHALTHGWLNGEVIRRITGKSFGANLAERIADPLGVDMSLGRPGRFATPPAHMALSAELLQYWKDEAEKPEPNWPYRAMTLGHALPAELVTPDGGFNDPVIQGAEIPGAGGIASARALATIWSATVTRTNGLRLLGEDIVKRATQTQSSGAPVFFAPQPYCRWGMGFQLDSEARRYLGARSFGHDGAGGQVGFADPDHAIGFGYVTNWLMGAEDTRATAVIDALRALVS